MNGVRGSSAKCGHRGGRTLRAGRARIIRVCGRRTRVRAALPAFAEVERDLISERTREGLARAKSSGRKLGRPKGSLGVSRFDGKEDEIRRFLELGVSKTAIAKITGVSRTALYSFMSTRGLRPTR